ncbi:hypothetical protein E6O75_ATG00998 [Venturia nashicola]|uniref:Uncharacterized protein n=1 Tax=Venturia nashicola TaxID=86259 RepID=A0A4Z1PQU3_9PEZI|nr:hypothetical protein E6O75_ATG00998 [Venturia nashicola]
MVGKMWIMQLRIYIYRELEVGYMLKYGSLVIPPQMALRFSTLGIGLLVMIASDFGESRWVLWLFILFGEDGLMDVAIILSVEDVIGIREFGRLLLRWEMKRLDLVFWGDG